MYILDNYKLHVYKASEELLTIDSKAITVVELANSLIKVSN